MTKQEALQVLEQATATIHTDRKNHQIIIEALQTLKSEEEQKDE